MDTITNNSKGYAFCEFEKDSDALKCVKLLHGYDFIFVSEKKIPKNNFVYRSKYL